MVRASRPAPHSVTAPVAEVTCVRGSVRPAASPSTASAADGGLARGDQQIGRARVTVVRHAHDPRVGDPACSLGAHKRAVHVPVDDARLGDPTVHGLPFGICCLGLRGPPGILRAGMHQGQRAFRMQSGQRRQPGEPLLSQRLPRCGRHFAQHRPEGIEGGSLGGKRFEFRRREEHLAGVAHHARPAEIADVIDDLDGARSAVGEISAMEHEVRRGLPQVGKHGFKGR